MKVVQTVLFLILSSCGHSPLRVYSSSEKESVFHKDGLWKISKTRAEELLKDNKNLVVKAIIHCHNGDTEKGLNLLKFNYSKVKKDSEYWNASTICFILRKDYDHALQAAEQGLNQKPLDKTVLVKLLHNKALIFHKIEHFSDAERLYKQVLNLNPNALTTKFNLGLLYLQFNLTKDALTHLQPLLKHAPNDIDLLSSIALAHSLNGDYNKALVYFERIPSESRSREDIALYYAVTLIGAKKYKLAREVMKEQDVPFVAEIRKMSRKVQVMIEGHLQDQARAQIQNSI